MRNAVLVLDRQRLSCHHLLLHLALAQQHRLKLLKLAVALPGTRSPHTAMSTSGGGAVIDSMDTTTGPSPGSQGAEPPPSPGPRDEAGAADEGNRPRTRQFGRRARAE